MSLISKSSAYLNNVYLCYSVESNLFVLISAYYILTQDCLLPFYFVFAFSLITNRNEILPCPEELLEELPSHVVISVLENVLFSTTLLLATDFLIHCDVPITQIWNIFSTAHKVISESSGHLAWNHVASSEMTSQYSLAMRHSGFYAQHICILSR